MKDLIESPAWLALKEHYENIKDVHMRDMFADDPHRFEKFSTSLKCWNTMPMPAAIAAWLSVMTVF